MAKHDKERGTIIKNQLDENINEQMETSKAQNLIIQWQRSNQSEDSKPLPR